MFKSFALKLAGQVVASVLKLILVAVGTALMARGWTDPTGWENVSGAILTAFAGIWATIGSATNVKIGVKTAVGALPAINAASQAIHGKNELPPY